MEPFPEDVARFLYDHVESIDQLEILRVLGEERDKQWNSDDLAVAAQADPRSVRSHIEAMHARGLLEKTTGQGAGLSCRYGPRTAELENMVARLLQIYRERPVSMIKLVYERAKDPLRAFADAFRFRKES
ncbi:MAG: hypothetical protein ACYC61_03975 [Isosphaeraceae bacterium]